MLKAVVEVGGAIAANLVSFSPLSGEFLLVCLVLDGMGERLRGLGWWPVGFFAHPKKTREIKKLKSIFIEMTHNFYKTNRIGPLPSL